MATTEDAIVDRVRAVLDELEYTEATGPDFLRTASGVAEGAYVVAYESRPARSWMGLAEEARGTVVVQLARASQNDYDAVRRLGWQDARAIVNAIVEDGSTSGIYAVEDEGREARIEYPKGASHCIVRARVPINFEAAL